MYLPRIPRPRPRYADIAATLALVIAMGGTAYAASTLPPDSVGPTQLQTSAVTNPKIAPGAVTNSKLLDGAVTGSKLGDGSVTTAKLGDGSVTTAQVGDGSVTNAKLGAGSVSNSKLGAGSVTNSKLAANSITSSTITNNSVSLADLVGADKTGTISFSVGAHGCGLLNLSVSGAAVGQVAYFSFIGDVAVPSTVLVGPMKVTATNTIHGYVCNVGATSVSVSGIGVRVITLG